MTAASAWTGHVQTFQRATFELDRRRRSQLAKAFRDLGGGREGFGPARAYQSIDLLSQVSAHLIASRRRSVRRVKGTERARLWFRRWCRDVAPALLAGISSDTVATALRGPPGRRLARRFQPFSSPQGSLILERLADTIFPNAPSSARLTRRPFSRGGLAAVAPS